MAGELAFFELGVEDHEKGRVFYGGLFGWELTPGPSGHGWVIGSAGVRGGMHGGDKGSAPYVFFAVDDMDAAVAKVRELGGTVEDMDVEGDEASQQRFGRLKLCRDDQGSSFGLHQRPAAS
jgi:predicted enzyme related to lactoylglutathione lyase